MPGGLGPPMFRLGETEQATLLSEYVSFAEVVHLPDPLPVDSRDRYDAVFLHLAIASGADMLVSGDKDLTVLAAVYPVVSAAGLRARLAAGH